MLWKTTRIIVIASIIFFWVVMMTLLFIREGYFTKSTWSFPETRWEQYQDWRVGIFTNDDKKVGYIQITTNPDPMSPFGPAFKLNVTFRLDTVLFSFPVSLSIRGFAWFSQRKGLENFQLALRSNESDIKISGEYDGHYLQGEIITGKETVPYSLPVGRDFLLTAGPALPLLDTPVLEPGQSISVDVFDPISRSVQKAIITSQSKEALQITGEHIETYRMAVTLSGLTSTVWVTPDQEIVQVTTPFGLKLKKISLTDTIARVPDAEKGDLISATAIKPKGMKPFRGARQMWVKIEGLTSVNQPPSSTYQVKTAQGYFIKPPAEPKNIPLTEKIMRTIPDNTLTGDALIQAEHPKIQKLANEIVGNEQDLWKKSQKIFNWVYNNIEKMISPNIPSALTVLETRQGDCNEHAVLFTALARAVGIPTRICIGLVWSEELQSFGYHAWVEVFIGEWTPIDPTLGQLIADATHIALIHGNIDQWLRLSSYVNQIQLEVVNIE